MGQLCPRINRVEKLNALYEHTIVYQIDKHGIDGQKGHVHPPGADAEAAADKANSTEVGKGGKKAAGGPAAKKASAPLPNTPQPKT